MKTILSSILIFGSLFTIFSCQETVQTPALIQPPIASLDKAFTNYTIDASKGGEITYETGSTVSIPANAFKDSLGNTVTGKVNIMYREFHDATDILLSGIPMQYQDTTGKNQVFQTAGMLEIRAQQNGKDIFLQEGKSVGLRTASFQEDDGYNFYFLDEENRQWQEQGKPNSEVNTEKVALLKDIEKRKPVKFPYSANEYFVFEYMDFLDIYLKNEYHEIKNRRQDPTIRKKAKDYGLATYSFKPYKQVKYNGREYPAGQILWRFTDKKRRFPKWVDDLSYWKDTVKFTYYGANKYGLLLEDVETGKKLYAELEAVMPIKFLLRHSPTYWQNNYETTLAALEEEEKEAQKMAGIYRSFNVNQMGIYNYDYLMKDESSIMITARFDIDWPQVEKKDFATEMINKSVYMILSDNRTLIKYDEHSWERFMLLPNQELTMFAIVSDSEQSWIQLFPKEKYGKIDFESLRGVVSPEYFFDFDDEKIKIESAQDIRNILAIDPNNTTPTI